MAKRILIKEEEFLHYPLGKNLPYSPEIKMSFKIIKNISNYNPI
jgi:hypothetical protein